LPAGQPACPERDLERGQTQGPLAALRPEELLDRDVSPMFIQDWWHPMMKFRVIATVARHVRATI
jgi:hypothetical protein